MNGHRPMRNGDMTASFVRILLQMMNEDSRDTSIIRLTDNYEPDIQLRLYDFVREMICSWAGQQDLSQEDATVIEDCRKICDVMGWMVK